MLKSPFEVTQPDGQWRVTELADHETFIGRCFVCQEVGIMRYISYIYWSQPHWTCSNECAETVLIIEN